MDTEFKWIETSPGHYKTVPLTDDRPEVKLPNKKGLPYFIERPAWGIVRDKLMPDPQKMDANGETRAIDVMMEERAKETRHSSKWRKWEAGRKKEWQRNKPAAMKERAYQDQKRRLTAIKEKLGV